MSLSRRAVLAGGLALSACKPSGAAAPAAPIVLGPLKALAPFAVGTAVQAGYFDIPEYADLVATQFSQVTPEWEMKMEYIVQDDGSLKFDAPDRIAAFARQHGMRLYGTTLVWYAQKPPWFERLSDKDFGPKLDEYLTTVVRRYPAAGWDVVNEAITEDGTGLRSSMWSQRLGELGHMTRAFQVTKAADPTALRFINEYYLESIPAKLDTYQRLIERLLAAGAPLTGIGCQTHCNADLKPGGIAKAVAAIGRFGLPIHISEMDVSIARAKGLGVSRAAWEQAQARLYGEAMEAFCQLPAPQRFAFSVWGARDSESWLRGETKTDTPDLFDGQGRPKLATKAWADAIKA
ncbi:MAG: Endo,4-beta-xylanase [Caulobacteraceae bacterium]|nr:Endo,4-beta-xylanase [Caulobacteraceae bacterium]